VKVLVDTCVWSLCLRRKINADLRAEELRAQTLLIETIQDHRAAILGPIRQEILSGIRNQEQFAKTERLLAPFPDEEILASDYIEAARAFNLCRSHGVPCGTVDILLCAVATRNRWSVLTLDRNLQHCMEVLRKEGLHRD
jgi:hypothetical protein